MNCWNLFLLLSPFPQISSRILKIKDRKCYLHPLGLRHPHLPLLHCSHLGLSGPRPSLSSGSRSPCPGQASCSLLEAGTAFGFPPNALGHAPSPRPNGESGNAPPARLCKALKTVTRRQDRAPPAPRPRAGVCGRAVRALLGGAADCVAPQGPRDAVVLRQCLCWPPQPPSHTWAMPNPRPQGGRRTAGTQRPKAPAPRLHMPAQGRPAFQEGAGSETAQEQPAADDNQASPEGV